MKILSGLKISFIKIVERRSYILVLTLLIAAITISTTISPVFADSDKRMVKVMTYNMDAGTDLLYFFSGIDAVSATQATYTELLATDFQGRARLLANQIAIEQPDLISLQEVTLWQTISVDSEGSENTAVLADQLKLLMYALAARHQHYRIVASQDLTDIMGPLDDTYSLLLSFLDRNVILARTDLEKSEMRLSNMQAGIYLTTIVPLPGFPPELNGWLSVDVKVGDKSFRFFATHLESPISVSDYTQYLQGLELVGILDQSPYPVILAGDFNSDASGLNYGPDLTPTAGMISGEGYADAWSTWQMNHPGTSHKKDYGLTWPLYLEDPPVGEILHDGLPYPSERIDLIFVDPDLAGDILHVDVVGNKAPFPSDHAGVVATLQMEKCKHDQGDDRSHEGDHKK